jgi:predicted solute-binding protein
MATRDGAVRVFEVGPGEALAVELAQAGVAAALDALRAGGYARPTDEQFRQIAHRVTREALAAGVAIHATKAEFSDDELDDAAQVTAHEAVCAVLGAPPAVN